MDFPHSLASLVKKLERWRKILARSVEQLNSKKDAQLLELYARPVVDMAVEILMGYLLLKTGAGVFPQNENSKNLY